MILNIKIMWPASAYHLRSCQSSRRRDRPEGWQSSKGSFGWRTRSWWWWWGAGRRGRAAGPPPAHNPTIHSWIGLTVSYFLKVSRNTKLYETGNCFAEFRSFRETEKMWNFRETRNRSLFCWVSIISWNLKICLKLFLKTEKNNKYEKICLLSFEFRRRFLFLKD